MQSLTTFAAIRTFSCWTDSQAIMWRKTSFDIHIEGRQFHIGNFYLKTPNFLLTYSLTAAPTLILNQLFQLVIQLITNTEPDHGGCCLALVEFKRHKNRSTADPRTLHWSWIDDAMDCLDSFITFLRGEMIVFQTAITWDLIAAVLVQQYQICQQDDSLSYLWNC